MTGRGRLIGGWLLAMRGRTLDARRGDELPRMPRKAAPKGQVHAGQHRPIVDRDLWDACSKACRIISPRGKRGHERLGLFPGDLAEIAALGGLRLSRPQTRRPPEFTPAAVLFELAHCCALWRVRAS
jgi:hypothetical protein